MKPFVNLSLSNLEVVGLIMMVHTASETTFTNAETKAVLQTLAQKIYKSAGVEPDDPKLPLGEF